MRTCSCMIWVIMKAIHTTKRTKNFVRANVRIPPKKFGKSSCMIWVIMKAVACKYDRNAWTLNWAEHTYISEWFITFAIDNYRIVGGVCGGPSSYIHYTLRLNNKETLPVQALTLYLLVIFFKSIFFCHHAQKCARKFYLIVLSGRIPLHFLKKAKKDIFCK